MFVRILSAARDVAPWILIASAPVVAFLSANASGGHAIAIILAVAGLALLPLKTPAAARPRYRRKSR